MKTLLVTFRKKKLLLVTLILVTIAVFGTSIKKPEDDRRILIGYVPKDGFVPDKITAIKIAIAVWVPVYGKIIYSEKPYSAELKNGVWFVQGSLPEGSLGGVAEILIQKSDGKILKVIHGK
jgi:hypothetical protein